MRRPDAGRRGQWVGEGEELGLALVAAGGSPAGTGFAGSSYSGGGAVGCPCWPAHASAAQASAHKAAAIAHLMARGVIACFFPPRA